MKQLKKEIKDSILLTRNVIQVDVVESETFIDIIVVDCYHDVARYKFSKRVAMTTFVSGDEVKVDSIEKMNVMINNYIIRRKQNV